MSADHLTSPKAETYDVEAGSNLSRQMSVSLTAEQFERLYLQPGGTAAKGDLAKRFGNPTPLGIISFLLCLTPLACDLMGWAGASAGSAATLAGPAYLIGGIGLYLAGIGEFILGNTFAFIVFASFGGFWSSYGFFVQPSQGIAAAIGAASTDFNGGFAMYLVWWAVTTAIYLVTALRTNVVFVLLFFFLEITFDLLIAAYIDIGYGNVGRLDAILKTAGVFAFLTTLTGWYLFIVLMFGSTGIPFQLPIGDLSGFLSGKKVNRD